MAGERQLASRREDADADVRFGCLGREHVNGLAEADLARERLQGLFGDLAGVGEDRELVARQRHVGEDVGEDEAKGGHEASLELRLVPACS